MIRISEKDRWILIGHRDHARLAGAFADRWGNAVFAKPEPYFAIREAVARHDDAWAERDAEPELTPEGLPSAFSRELVGTYDAFEEIDFAAYLRVRAGATEAVAIDNPYAAILVSMHTHNLLTEQADLTTLSEEGRALHATFIEGQVTRRAELAAALRGRPCLGGHLDKDSLQRGFEFLQACDSLSLIACVRYDQPLSLRHSHPTRGGDLVSILCEPLGGDTYRLNPYPFDEPEVVFEVPYKAVSTGALGSIEAFRAAYHEATPEAFRLSLIEAE